MPFADLDGRDLFYERRGSGEPLLLIMGMAGHHKIWDEPLLTGLAEDFEVLVFDHRGIGDSADVDGQFTTLDLANDTAALLDHVGWDSAHVMGISLGGMVAQELVLNHPERVRTLVLGCTYAGGEGSTLESPGVPAMFAASQTGDAEASVRAGYESNLSPTWREDESHWPAFRDVVASVRMPLPVIMRQAVAGMMHNTYDRLPSIEAPTAVIHGTVDDIIVYQNGPQIASRIPGSTLRTMENVGHLFFLERTDETLEIIRKLARTV